MKIKKVETIEINGFNWIKEDILLKGNPHMLYEEALFQAERLNARIPDKEDFSGLIKLQRRYEDGWCYVSPKKEYLSDPEKCLVFNASQGYRQQNKHTIALGSGFYWAKEREEGQLCYIMLADEFIYTDSAPSLMMEYQLSLKLIKL